MFHFSLASINSFLEKKMPLITPLGVITGFLLGQRILFLSPFVTAIFACMTFSGALNLTIKDFATVTRRPKPVFAFLIAFHIVTPLLSRAVTAILFPNDPALVMGFVLLFSIPTAVSGFIWTSIHGGNIPLILSLILLDTILAPLSVPLTIRLLTGTVVNIDTASMFASLILMVVLPSFAGILANRGSEGKIPLLLGPSLKVFSKIALFAVIVINAARVSLSVTAFETVFVLIALVAVALSLSGYGIGRLSSLLFKLDRADTVSVMYASGMRNISAALVLALTFFPERAALPVLSGILFQQILASVSGVVLVQKVATNGHGAPDNSDLL